MAIRNINIDINIKEILTATISIGIGKHQIEHTVPILCPNQDNGNNSHYIVRNGKDTKTKDKYQQFWCHTCGSSFYAHTSKEFKALEIEIKDVIESTIKGGHIKIERLASRLNIKKSKASKLLGSILKAIVQDRRNYKFFLKKRRRSSVLFVDETFLTIHGKTWYIIVVMSGNNKIMDVKLVKHRTKDVLLAIIKDCEKRLLYGLKILISDGFTPYKGVALGIGHSLIHVRHIHKPPYGRVEFDIYKFVQGKVHITTGKTTNEITKINGYFIVRISVKKVKITADKKGRKMGSKNRSKEVIEAEKKRKSGEKLKRGRPKGSTNPMKIEEINVFFHNKKEGCMESRGGSSDEVAAALNEILKQFPNMHITTNLVEKEYSVLKKLVCFRGRRSVETWIILLMAYYSIRDDPKILKTVLKNIQISPKTVIEAMPSLMGVGVMVN